MQHNGYPFMRARLVILVGCLVSTTPLLALDQVVLKSGETVHGLITTENAATIEIEEFLYSGSIRQTRTIRRHEIDRIDRETPDARKERERLDALARYQLDPDRVFRLEDYNQGTQAFETFLRDFPDSTAAPAIQEHLTAWRAERQQVEQGLVKLNQEWMTPVERQERLLAAAVAARQQRVAELEEQLAKSTSLVRGDEATLRSLQARIPNTPEMIDVEGVGAHGRQRPNPDRIKLDYELRFYREQVPKGKQRLAELQRELARAQKDLKRAEAALEAHHTGGD